MVMEEKTLAAGSQTLKKKHTDALRYFRFYCSSLVFFLRFTCTTELGVNAVIHRLLMRMIWIVFVCVRAHISVWIHVYSTHTGPAEVVWLLITTVH